MFKSLLEFWEILGHYPEEIRKKCLYFGCIVLGDRVNQAPPIVYPLYTCGEKDN